MNAPKTALAKRARGSARSRNHCEPGGRAPLWRLEINIPRTNIYLKLEAVQPTGSFKARSALNALKQRRLEISDAGVVTPGAGNFGLSLVWAARDLGVRATIAVPAETEVPQKEAFKKFGAKLQRAPRDLWWQMMAVRRDDIFEGTLIHPFADNHVIAGNATIAAEILEDFPNPSARRCQVNLKKVVLKRLTGIVRLFVGRQADPVS